MVGEGHFDIGLAQDGDADRIGIIDENGVVLNTLEVFALLALYVLEVRNDRRPIVKTVTSSSMLNRLGQIYGVPVFETPVVFKYVAPVMLRENASIGGEESGGYGFRGHIPERDSIVAGLFFLDFMVKTGKTPSQLLQYLFSKVGPHFYQREDISTTPEKSRAIKEYIAGTCPIEIAGYRVDHLDSTDGFRYIFTDGSWLLIRFSGTEPVIRVYSESDSVEKVSSFIAAGKALLGL
jgi:phosphomannomutase